MTPAATDLDLLMVHADDHAPVIHEGLDAATAQGRHPGEPTSPRQFWDEGGDPNDLALQRWGVIAPRGPEGDRLLALIEPLIAHRQDQQHAPIKIYRVPPQMTQDEAMRWRKREFDDGADLNIEVPRYQLILGDLDQVPLALQQVQQSDGYVGRLAFTREDDYAAYVDKLLRWEKLSSGTADADSLFFTVHDGTAATAAGHRALIAPGVELLRRRQTAGQYPARDILELGDLNAPSPDELLARAAASSPGVLFSLSHGEGAPRGGWHTPEEQRRRQGAMSFGRAGQLTGDELQGRSFMPGGVWFMLACYGAGTPSTSAYKHWLAQLAAAGQFRGKPEAVLAGLPGPRDRPFIAALPQAALANSNGPLAFIGHVDLAWTYGFQELDDGAHSRPARYMGITRSLHKRDRTGVALRELLRYFDQTNLELTGILDREAADRSAQPDLIRQGHLWMLRQDLAAYILLGDPAVRLPGHAAAQPNERVAPERPRLTDIRSVDISATDIPTVDIPATADPTESRNLDATPPADIAATDLEDAVLQYILAERTITAAAARVGRSRAELERLAAAYRQHGAAALT
jgi:hypothetical protein